MVHTHEGHLSPEDSACTAEFVRAFTDIENLLKRRLSRPPGDRTDASDLIRMYLDLNPYWGRVAHALELVDVRDKLGHKRAAAKT